MRIVVGFPPGGGTDALARVVGTKLTEMWKQQVIVENKAGGSGRIGAESVARSEPDGYTILIGSPAETIVARAPTAVLVSDGIVRRRWVRSLPPELLEPRIS